MMIKTAQGKGKQLRSLKMVASSATFRQRLNELGESYSFQTLLDEQLVNHLRKVPDFGKLTIHSGNYIPLSLLKHCARLAGWVSKKLPFIMNGTVCGFVPSFRILCLSHAK